MEDVDDKANPPEWSPFHIFHRLSTPAMLARKIISKRLIYVS
jgi:hypothetical protein